MKKVFVTFIISFTLAIASTDNKLNYRQPTPIVYKIDYLPQYQRKKPLKRHFVCNYGVELV